MSLQHVVVASASLLLAPGALSQEEHQSAQVEIENEMRASLAEIPPPQLRVDFVPIDQPGYKLEKVNVNLDGQPVAAPRAEALSSGGRQQLFSGAVTQGKHEVLVTYEYAADAGLFSYMTGYKFVVPVKATFDTRRGLRTIIDTGVHVDNRIDDWKKRLTRVSARRDEMLAKVDDSDLPPPPPRLVPLTQEQSQAAVASAEQPPPEPAEKAAKHGKKSRGGAKTARTRSVAAAPKPAKAAATEEPKVAMAEPAKTEAAPPAPQVASPAAAPPAVAAAPVAAATPAPAAAENAGGAQSKGIVLLAAGLVLVLAGLGIARWRRRRPLQLPPE